MANMNDMSQAEETRKSLKLDPTQEQAVKALVTGYSVDPNSQTDGAAVRYQQLDGMIRNVTYGTNDFTILRQLMDSAKLEAKSTVQQYAIFEKHGKSGHQLFQPEIAISDIETPHLKQKTVEMKFIVANRAESFASQRVSNIEDTDRINELDAVVSVGKTIEGAIFYGDSDLASQTGETGLEFDGLEKLIDSNNFIDNQGRALTPDTLNNSINRIAKGFGTATDAWMPVGVKADFDNQFLGAQRIAMPTPQGTVVGTDVEMFNGARGRVKLHDSTIMDMDLVLDTDFELDAKAPSKPEFAGAVEVKSANGTFRAAGAAAAEEKMPLASRTGLPDDVGRKMSYVAVAVNKHGDSLASEPIEATVTAADSAVKLSVKPLAGYGRADYIAFYRQDPETGQYWRIARVGAKHAQDDGTIQFLDTNARIPGTADVFMGELNKMVIGLYELLPMTRVNTATITTASNFLCLWYGSLMLAIPKRFAMIKNVRYIDKAPAGASYMQNAGMNGTA